MEIHFTILKFLLLIYSGRVSSGGFTFLVNICVSRSQLCMGALIDTQWVLTAAHCVVDDGESPSNNEIELKMGVTYPQTRRIDKVIAHQGYHPQTKLDDIALVKLNKAFRLSTEVSTIALDRMNIDHNDIIVTVATWGSTVEEDLTCMDGELTVLSLPLLSASDCKKIYSSITYNHHFLNNKVNCVGSYGDSSCNGDAGSPVVYDDKLVAIVSLNSGCRRNPPSLNLKVAYYSQWIDVTRKQGVLKMRISKGTSTKVIINLRFIFLSVLLSILFCIL